MACDTCGRTGVRLNQLMELYRTDDISEVCDECEKIAKKHLNVIQQSHIKAQQSLIKRFLQALRIRSIATHKEGT